MINLACVVQQIELKRLIDNWKFSTRTAESIERITCQNCPKIYVSDLYINLHVKSIKVTA